MHVKTTVRVGAYIIRQNPQGLHQLLLFRHPDCPEAPVQIPGGGVESQESLECALHREIFEECGLSGLTIIRKLGVAEICWRQPHKLASYRHCFLLQAPRNTPDAWDQVVQGDGIDAGMKFSYFWHRPTNDFRLPADLGYFLYPEHIPELYYLNQQA
ncbi:NUDIX domain-containing protein [Cyanobacteria bacterium FACHB-502]|nr:NUDIX domain-containing protein [Cyanobacteria bacterium FACHB-502]